MRIKSLDPNVVKKLRSDIAFSSVAQCVEELVWNSIDSGANCVAVRLNLPVFKIQVIDNGCGIPPDQMVLVGKRYATSKCHTLEDLQNLQYGGFRGEALASLKEVASNLMIESRAHNCPETYCKIFTHGKTSAPTLSITSRPSKGTTVTVFDFLYNRPVRKQAISEAIDLEETRRLLQSIALVHPQISFSLQNEATGEMCLQFRKCSSIFYAFMELFGKDKAKHLKQVEYQLECYKINGCISVDSFSSKDYQFLYVNKRLLRKTRLHAIINSLLNKAFSRRQLDPLTRISSPSKNQSQYGAFMLDIVCDRDKYDTVFDRKRTMVEFSEWEIVSKLVEDAVLSFLNSEKLISFPVNEDELQSTNLKISKDDNSRFLNLGVDNFKNGLFSHAVKRLESRKPIDDFSLEYEKNNDNSIDSNLLIVKENEDIETVSIDTKTIQENSTVFHNCKNDISDIISRYKNYICLGNASKPSVLETLKETSSKGITKADKTVSLSSTITSIPTSIRQPDIPCRSVFPIESPVMLRVQAESTLSQLKRKIGPSSMMLNLKEKYLFTRQKSKKMPDKVAPVESNQHESPIKLVTHHENTTKNKNKIDYNIQKTQESHSCLTDKNDCRITSKYRFHDDTLSSPLKCLRQSNKAKKKLSVEVVNPLEMFSVRNENYKHKANPTSFICHVPEQKVFETTPKTFRSLEKEIIDSSQIQQQHKPNKICENSSPNCKVSQILIEDSIKLLKNKKYSLDNKSSSKFPETRVSNFFLKTFSPNKRKINEDILAQENSERKIENFPLLNFNQHKNQDVDKNMKSNAKNSENCNIFLDGRIQTSIQLVTPHNLFPTKKLKSCSAITNSNKTIKELKEHSDQSDELNTTTFSDTDSPVSKKERRESLASRLFQDLNAEIYPTKIIESDQLSKIDFPEESNSFSISTHNVKELVIQNYLTTDVPSDSTYSSHEAPNIILHQKERSVSTISKTIFRKQSGNGDNVDDAIEQRLSSTTDSSPELNFHSKPMHNEFSAHEIPKTILTADQNVPPSVQEFLPAGNETDLVMDSSNKIDSCVDSNVPYATPPKFKTVFADSSQSSIIYSPTVAAYHEGYNSSLLKQYSFSPCVLKVLSLEELDLTSISKTSFPCNAITDKATLKFPECMSVSIVENSTNRTSLPHSETQTQTNYTDKLLEKSEDSNLHIPIKNLSNHPINLVNIEVTDTSCSKLSQDKKLSPILKVDEPMSELNSTTTEQAEDVVNKSRWIQVNEETKRVAYIDSITGNSTYNVPVTLQDKEASSTKDLAEIQKKKPHFFLTHDFSPFVRHINSPKESEDIDSEICDLQIDLNSYIDSNENTDWHRKWRNPIEKTTSCDDSIQDMFQKWENPMFDIAPEINGVEDSKVPVCLPHMYFLNSYRFNSNSLESLKVIGQVDCKFIACIIQDFSDNSKNRRLLTLFDQHAVHERIKLEEFIDDLYETKEGGKRIVKSQLINPPLNVSLEPSEVRLLRSYHSSLQDLGISISLKDDIDTVEAFSLPVCLVNKDTNQLRRKLSEMSVLVEKIIKEWLSAIMQNRGITSRLPKTLGAVLNSQACRSAVKFGDPLNFSQCERLLTSLTNCKLPFQCAHGRPSIAPILDLNKVEAICKKRPPPKLWKLHEDIKKN